MRHKIEGFLRARNSGELTLIAFFVGIMLLAFGIKVGEALGALG